MRRRTGESGPSQRFLHRHAADYPLVERSRFHHYLSPVGQFESHDLREVLQAEQHAARTSPQVAAAPIGQRLLR
jgi:hypothetical protein